MSINILLGLAFILATTTVAGTGDKRKEKNYKDEILKLRQGRRVSKQKVKRDLKIKRLDLRGQNYYLHLKKGTREQRVRNILEQIFRMPFPSVKPSWLINPKTNRRLELDCYDAGLMTAFEVDGEQHTKYLPFYHKTYQKFLDMKSRDMMKNMMCKQKRINLIRIPYTIDDNNLEEFIMAKVGNSLGRQTNKKE